MARVLRCGAHEIGGCGWGEKKKNNMYNKNGIISFSVCVCGPTRTEEEEEERWLFFERRRVAAAAAKSPKKTTTTTPRR
jgi:hypothetical protein